MADPTPYVVSYSFTGFQTSSPADPLPAPQVDNELANIATAISGTITALKDIRRSDGKLRNGLVTVDSMSAGVLAALSDLDETEAGEVDDAIAQVKTDLEADLTAGLATKANVSHTHAASTITVSAITGIVGADVQAVLAELRLLAPQTGDLKLSMNTTAPAGWVACNDGTIGDASSGASTRANADTAALYALLWSGVSDTYAPVTTGRGVSAAADFAAHKPLALTKMLGRALALAGAGATLTSRALGETAGEETHALTSGENGPHTHTITDPGHTHTIFGAVSGSGPGSGTFLASVSGGGNTVSASHTTGISVDSAGSGTAHNNMQPTSFLHAFLKL